MIFEPRGGLEHAKTANKRERTVTRVIKFRILHVLIGDLWKVSLKSNGFPDSPKAPRVRDKQVALCERPNFSKFRCRQ